MVSASAQHQWYVTVSGISGAWDTFSGGEKSVDTNPYYDGGARQPDVIPGRPTTDNITLSRAFKRDRDDVLIKSLRSKVGSRFTVSRVSTDVNGSASGGQKTVYSNAVLARVGEPEYDANGDDVATYEIEFAISQVS